MSAETPGWQPTPVGECLRCGATVTPRFARVCGDNNNDIHACPECAGMAAAINGLAARGEKR